MWKAPVLFLLFGRSLSFNNKPGLFGDKPESDIPEPIALKTLQKKIFLGKFVPPPDKKL
jgi:hypothetical protein